MHVLLDSGELICSAVYENALSTHVKQVFTDILLFLNLQETV